MSIIIIIRVADDTRTNAIICALGQWRARGRDDERPHRLGRAVSAFQGVRAWTTIVRDDHDNIAEHDLRVEKDARGVIDDDDG